MDLVVDTSDDPKTSVRDKYVEKLEELLKKDGKLHAPPIVEFVWGKQKFRGVLQSLEVTYVLFHTDGTPLRAKLAVQIKEHRKVKVQLSTTQQSSPDVEKRYVVRAGETLSSISAAVFRDPGHWREIAVANDIADPRAVAPGTVLTIPRLEEPIR
jgi:nucleoid-associated protein YgaU